MHQAKASSRAHHEGKTEGEADQSVVRQLMFNRILAHMRLLWVDGVSVTGFDAETGTVRCSLTGVKVVVSVSLGEA